MFFAWVPSRFSSFLLHAFTKLGLARGVFIVHIYMCPCDTLMMCPGCTLPSTFCPQPEVSYVVGKKESSTS